MPYVQNSDRDRAAMLERVGVGSVDELFAPIPEALRLAEPPPIGPGSTEDGLVRALDELAARNRPSDGGACFLGGGAYDHGWLALVDHVMQRSEFLTAYTPYQPECSQGTLQWIFEFQTMIADLCGMEVANASMYDGASAAAEAAVLALAQTRRSRIVVSAGLHPHTRQTLRTYLTHLEVDIVEAPLGADGRTDWGELVDDATAAVLVQQPNFVGAVEELGPVADAAHGHGALAVASIYPVAMGLLRSPGEADFDVVVGDGQSLGVPLAFGGPAFGFFATRQAFVRRMPGRLVGQSVDREGRRAFTLAFQTREQHIRREKATSNICTNNSLMALRGCVHLATLGPRGLEEVALASRARALQVVRGLGELGIPLAFPDTPFFNEPAFRLADDGEVARFRAALAEHGIRGGLALARDYPDLAGVFTLACTERVHDDDVARLLAAARAFQTQEVAS